MNLRVYDDARKLSEAAAQVFVEEARRRIDESGRFAVAFAGGSTPRMTYEILAREYGGPEDLLDWGGVHAFFGDERTVPPDHEDSNYRMAQEALLSRVPVGSVHRMRGEMEPQEAAALYEKELEDFFDGAPVLDLSCSASARMAIPRAFSPAPRRSTCATGGPSKTRSRNWAPSA